MGVVVEALDVEGGEDGLLNHCGKGVAFVIGAAIDEVERGVGEVDGEGVVGGGDGEVGSRVGSGICSRDDPVEGGLSVGRGGGICHRGFAFPTCWVRRAIDGNGIEEGGKCIGADWKRSGAG